MLLSNQQKYILEILKEFKYLRVRQLHAMVRTHYRAQGIEIDARRMEIMLRQMRTGTNYVWLRGRCGLLRRPQDRPSAFGSTGRYAGTDKGAARILLKRRTA